jgi:hypothetical protein
MLVGGVAGVDNVLAVDSPVGQFLSHGIPEIDTRVSR